MNRSRPFIAAVATIAMWAGGAPQASACAVPVFRYALELWPPDHFPLYLLHRGELDDADRALVDLLSSASQANGINLRLVTLDVEGELEPESRAIWESLEDPELARPLLALRTPARLGPPTTVLTLELTPEHIEQLLDSPARKEVARRILDGHSVVWVLLEGGQADRDDAAFGTLIAEIARLEGTLELPEPSADDPHSSDAEPLELVFSAIRVGRDDPAERAFVELLLNVEPDLKDAEFDGTPMVFPVFGRGRALYALVGDGIVPATIEDAARYLTGACQCTVKAENPGADLLMAVDWDRYVTPTLEPDAVLPPLGGLASFAGPADDPPSPTPAPSAVALDDPERAGPEAEAEAPGPLARQAAATTEAAPDLGDLTTSRADDGPRPGLDALLIVSALGIMVLLAGVVLTRRDA